MSATGPGLVVLHCFAGPAIGLGHFVRCLALAEELKSRRIPVHFAANLGGIAWAERQLRQRPIACHCPADGGAGWLIEHAGRENATVVLVDRYDVDANFLRELQGHGFVVAALADRPDKEYPVDMLIDQNVGAENQPYVTREDTLRLCGADFALLRGDVRFRHNAGRARRHPDRVRRVLVTMGGTDPQRLNPKFARAVLETGLPVDVRVLAADREQAEAVQALPKSADQHVLPLRHIDDVSRQFLWCDLAVTAAGSACWEMACLFTPMAVVWTVENQRVVHDGLMRHHAAHSLGEAAQLGDRLPILELRSLMEDLPRRRALGEAAGALIDGRGAARVADALIHRAATMRLENEA